jgi:hypothetical protein
MRYLRLALLPLVLAACAEKQLLSPEVDGLAFGASAGWSDWYMEFGPGDFEFPADCIDETMAFEGKVWFTSHYVAPSGAPHNGLVHENWHGWYEGEFSSVTTGNQWFPQNVNNHGVWWGPTYAGHSANHEFIWMTEEGTGRRIQTSLKVHYVENANGDVQVDRIDFTCFLR